MGGGTNCIVYKSRGGGGGGGVEAWLGGMRKKRGGSLGSLAGSPGPGGKDGKFPLWGQGIKFL